MNWGVHELRGNYFINWGNYFSFGEICFINGESFHKFREIIT